MATGWPMKTTYANGDVYSASDVNDTNGTINLLGASVAYAAGKNKLINGDFYFNQRAFSSTTTNAAYGFDRWVVTAVDGTTTYSAQAFTPGTAPVAGYESVNFARLVSTGQTLTTAQSRLTQRIEDVRTIAGQTVTMSFWAKASTGTPNIAVSFAQNFGSGGSATVSTNGQKFAITSSWVRYSKTFSIPSVSGKTIGAGSYTNTNLWISAGSDQNTQTDTLGIQSITVDFWGVQVEQGSTATAFQTATGTIQGELAACQRYFEVINGAALAGTTVGTTQVYVVGTYKVQKRIDPTLTGLQTVVNVQGLNSGGGYKASTASTYAFNSNNAQGFYGLAAVITGFTGLTGNNFVIVNDTNNIISASAEL
jgi:hypothetical protein